MASLFAGCGGMDLGFVGGFDFLSRHYPENGFDAVWANEPSPAACRTYRANFGHGIIEGEVRDHVDDVPGGIDVVIGGFPCQDVSINGKGTGAICGKRTGLYRVMVDIVDRVRPAAFVAENVKGLLMRHNADSLKGTPSDFRSLGYNVGVPRTYLAADYGVPQLRERVFFIGTRPDVPRFVPPPPASGRHIPVQEAIGDLEDREWDEGFAHVRSLAKRSPDQGNRRLVADCPGQTIRAECHGNIQWHYALSRRISMREAARLQSFPDTFRFVAKLRETERQIGNARSMKAWSPCKAACSK